ncbi:MAG: peptidoglycan-binding protein [Hyphomicrobiaceae bacterium]
MKVTALCGVVGLILGTPTFVAAQYIPSTIGHSKDDSSYIHKVEVIGKDQRVKLPQKYMKYAKGIGVIFEPGAGWACTAFCVAPSIIGTNAHCLIGRPGRQNRTDLSQVKFVFAPNSVTGFTHVSSLKFADQKQVYLSVYAGHYRAKRTTREFSNDWAFAKLDSQSCRGNAVEFADMSEHQINKAAKKKQVFMIGYHGDRGMQDKLLSTACTIRSGSNSKYFLPAQRRSIRSAGNLLPHTCDMFRGASGSPIFVKRGNSAKVVAINAGSTGFAKYRVNRHNNQRRYVWSRQTNLAIMSKTFLHGLKRFRTEPLISGKEDLRTLQQILKADGYYRGPIDALYGPGTRGAILKFEKDKQLAPLGIPTARLLEDARKSRLERKEELASLDHGSRRKSASKR